MKKNKKIMYAILGIVIIILIFIIILCFTNKKLTCSKTITNNDTVLDTNVVFALKHSKIDRIKINKVITINKTGDVDYVSAVKNILEETYNDLDITYKIEQRNNKLIIDLTYDKDKEYILDNINLSLEDNGINVEIISEDHENSYSSVDLSKKYTIENIKKEFSNNGYKCK